MLLKEVEVQASAQANWIILELEFYLQFFFFSSYSLTEYSVSVFFIDLRDFTELRELKSNRT